MPVIIKLYKCFITLSQQLQPLALLILRLWIAKIFWASGLVKISDFSNAVALFEQEYKVPLLPPYIAAVLGTTFELACPVFLTLGLATRAATLPLLAMTAVIQFTYDDNIEHFYWAMILFTLLAFGAGKWSVDHFVKQRYAA